MSRNKGRGRGAAQHAIETGFMPNAARDRRATSELMYTRVLTELSMNRFKWTGLPEGIDERFIEFTLFNQAVCIFYWEQSVGRYLAVQGGGLAPMNMYQNPTRFFTSNTPNNRKLTAEQAVPIWANYLRQPDHDIVHLFARKLGAVDTTVDVNLVSMRNTQIMFVPEEERLTWANIERQRAEGQPIIHGTPGLSMERIQSFQLGVDKDQVKNLMEVKARMWNEAMTLLGINNSNQDKKERLVADEVSANNDQVTAVRSYSLKARKQACEHINEKWGLNLGVEWDETVEANAQTMGFIHGGMGDE